MKKNYEKKTDGYRDSIEKGLGAAKYFNGSISSDCYPKTASLKLLKKELEEADAVVIGAGAGLSTSAGFTYSGERFQRYFYDFARKYGIRDMYTGGFYPFPDNETFWAWWARHIYCNRYVKAPKPVYEELLRLVEGKEYFVITTNVDHCFQKAGFDKQRLFYTQGDYGLFQSVNNSIQKTFDNEEWVIKAMQAQGFILDAGGVFQPPQEGELKMRIPKELIPKCPDDGSNMTLNLRSDDYFVEDEGWHSASKRYSDFLSKHENDRVLYLELGVGANTPVIIKFPFWYYTMMNERATYACLNFNESYCPEIISDRSICLEGDAGGLIRELNSLK